MRYEQYAFLWPPRPSSDRKVTPQLLPYWENKGWWAQIKKNGTGNVLGISPDRQIRAMRRDRTEHKLWSPLPEAKRTFQHLPGNGWYVFTAELLHAKVPGLRHINFLHDVLVADGEYLIDTTFAERQELLAELFPETTPSIDGHYSIIDQYTWLATNHKRGFRKLFDSLTRPDDEGLVLKNPAAKLTLCSSENANSSWQWKCRKTHKNYKY